jgi:superfamily II DNA or RNA helicase
MNEIGPPVIRIRNKISVEACPQSFESNLRARLTIDNPVWLENDRMGRWNGDTPPELRFYGYNSDGALLVPRGFIRQLLSMCKANGLKPQVVDLTRELEPVDFAFNGELRPYQSEALTAILSRRFGTVSMPTGSGKTVLALAAIAERKQPTLVICHTKELLNQWCDRIETFLGIPKSEIGIIGGGKKTVGDRVAVALVQSLYKCSEEVAPHIGFLICDECHRAPSRTFTEAVTAFDSKFMLGLSATPWRRDKLSRLIFWHLGDVVHQIDDEVLQETGAVLKADVILRETSFQTTFDPSNEYSKMLSQLTEDEQRNRLIVADVAKQASNGSGICLVLSDRKDHCQYLSELLEYRHNINAPLLTGDLPKKQREQVVNALNAGTIKVLCATGQLIGEGFDCRELSTLFLATPIKFDGRVLQYLGRVLRPAPGKEKAKVFDYVDNKIHVLRASAKSRARVYGEQ